MYRQTVLDRQRQQRVAHRDVFRERDRKRSANSLVNRLKRYVGRCIRCEYSRCMDALDWHHVFPEEKVTHVSELRRCTDIKVILDEIGKCVLICSNCHKEAHAGIWNPSELPVRLYGVGLKFDIGDLEWP